MKLLSLFLLGTIGLSASELGPVAATHAHVHAAYTPAPLIFAAAPRMGSCPARSLSVASSSVVMVSVSSLGPARAELGTSAPLSLTTGGLSDHRT